MSAKPSNFGGRSSCGFGRLALRSAAAARSYSFDLARGGVCHELALLDGERLLELLCRSTRKIKLGAARQSRFVRAKLWREVQMEIRRLSLLPILLFATPIAGLAGDHPGGWLGVRCSDGILRHSERPHVAPALKKCGNPSHVPTPIKEDERH